VPASGNKQARMASFWDPAHYTTALGTKLISGFTRGATKTFSPEAEITAENFGVRLAQVRQDRQRYRQREAQDLVAWREKLCAKGACLAPAGTAP
jgi:hypothetical protein